MVQARDTNLLRGSECRSKLSPVTTFSSTNLTFFKEPIPQVTTGGLHDDTHDDHVERKFMIIGMHR